MTRGRRRRVSLGLVLGLAIPLLVAAVIGLAGANRPVFMALQHASRVVPRPLFEAFWESATYLGDGLAAVVVAALFLRYRNDVALAIVIAAIPLVGAYTHAIRAFINVERPSRVLAKEGITILGPALQFGSFPSGHSATAAAMAGVICFAYRQVWVRALAIAGALVIAMSRAAVGVHWPIDISVGFAGGWLCAWLAWLVVGERSWASWPMTRLVTCAVLAGCAVALAFHPMGLPAALPLRIVLAVLGLVSALAALFAVARDMFKGRRRA